MANSERSRDAQRKAKSRAAERDIIIPPIADKQRRLELEQDDEAWMRYYFHDVFFNAFTDDQKQSLGEVAMAIQYGTKKCIAGPRGDGKTSITRYRLSKGLLTRQPTGVPECPFALYVAASDIKAKQSDQAIRKRFRTGCINKPGSEREFVAASRLGEDYPFECAVLSYIAKAPSRINNVTTNGGWKIHSQWSGDLILPSLEFGDEEEAWEKWMIKPGVMGGLLMACGITSSALQGANILDMRPRAVILDDLDNRESLAADKKKLTEDGTVAEKIGEIISKTISGMQGQGRSMGQVMLCTVTTRKSIAWRYSDPEQEPSWSGIRKKRVIQWPDRMDLWDQYIGLRQKGKSSKDDQGNTLDPHGRQAHAFYLDHYDEMNRGCVLGNDRIHDETELPDGTKTQETTVQWVFDFIADWGEESFRTEYQQEPPEDDEVDRLMLTAYHVQHNARSGLDRKLVPPETAGIACGMDIKKIGFHYVVWAFSSTPTRAVCIDYGFHETKFAGDQLRVEDAERAILNSLHEWREERDGDPYLDPDGNEYLIDLSLIDKGWKDETWLSQPVDHFCAEAGLDRFLPCRGWSDNKYRDPAATRSAIVGDNLHVSFRGDVCQVNWNADHWKMKVHEGFLTPPGQPGSLALFNPPKTRSGRRSQPHMSFAKHITAEVWEERFVPGYRGMVKRWWKDGSQNHYLDAAAQGLVARSLLGANTIDTAEPAPAAIAPSTTSNSSVPAAPVATIPEGRSW